MEQASNAQKTTVGLIVLAAGESRRMKQPKQLLIFKGKTLLRRAAETALASNAEKICVVLGANYEKLKTEISDLQLEIAFNENPRAGMSSSLKSGLKKLLEIEPNLSGVLVMLVDQPLVETALLNRLIEIFRMGKRAVVACEYGETFGVPAVFSSQLFDEILNLSVEGGAKGLIEEFKDSAEIIPAPEAAFDVDTPEDYARLTAS
jgi:Uncharacterized MobA-related protein